MKEMKSEIECKGDIHIYREYMCMYLYMYVYIYVCVCDEDKENNDV